MASVAVIAACSGVGGRTSSTPVPGGVPGTGSARFVYTANQQTNNISAFTVQSSGALFPIAGSPFASNGAGPTALAVSPNGSFLFVSNASTFGAANVASFTVDRNSGALTPISTVALPVNAVALALTVDPLGHFVFVIDSQSRSLFVFTIGPSGLLTAAPGSPVAVGLCPDSIAIDGSSRFVFVGNECDNTISGFTINGTTGFLLPIPGSPFVARPTPPQNPGKTPQGLHVAITPSGQFLFSADVTNNAIEAFNVNQATGILTLIGTFPGVGSSCPFASTVDRSGRVLYVADFCSDVITAYTIQANGFLTPLPRSPFVFAPMGAPVRDLKIDPSNRFLFTADSENNNVTVWTIAADGTLTPVAGSPFVTGSAPFGVAVSP